jgi:hypothetical protein
MCQIKVGISEVYIVFYVMYKCVVLLVIIEKKTDNFHLIFMYGRVVFLNISGATDPLFSQTSWSRGPPPQKLSHTF